MGTQNLPLQPSTGGKFAQRPMGPQKPGPPQFQPGQLAMNHPGLAAVNPAQFGTNHPALGGYQHPLAIALAQRRRGIQPVNPVLGT